MAHDVYICYDERDLEVAKNVCDALESNGLECWLKNRDAGVKNIVNEIMDAIKSPKSWFCFILRIQKIPISLTMKSTLHLPKRDQF